jgi:DnaK suppressor protein
MATSSKTKPATGAIAATKSKSSVAARASVAAAPAAAAPRSASAAKPTPAAAPASAPTTPLPLTVDAHKRYGPLTEAEILAMPESAYMNKDQLEFFRAKLTELHQHIIANASDTGEHLRDVEVATDPSDRATQEEEYTLELRTRDRERKLLKKVEKALRMIDDGSFGWCEETGEPIGIARLLARPTATLSIEAQERRERRQKLYGD